MLKSQLLHPQIQRALGRAGHGAKVLISDGNYPHWTKRGANAEVVFLNLAPGMVSVTDIFKTLLSAIVIEKAEVMDYARQGPDALKGDPAVWEEFRGILRENKYQMDLGKIERFAFYEEAGRPEVCLTVASGDKRIYANLLLTIGVVKAE